MKKSQVTLFIIMGIIVIISFIIVIYSSSYVSSENKHQVIKGVEIFEQKALQYENYIKYCLENIGVNSTIQVIGQKANIIKAQENIALKIDEKMPECISNFPVNEGIKIEIPDTHKTYVTLSNVSVNIKFNYETKITMGNLEKTYSIFNIQIPNTEIGALLYGEERNYYRVI